MIRGLFFPASVQLRWINPERAIDIHKNGMEKETWHSATLQI